MIKPCIKCGTQDRNKRGDCKPCAKESKRRHYKSNREKVCSDLRKYYEANKEQALARQRKWRESNREKAAEYHRKWREDNPDKELKCRRNWQKANPGKVKEISHNRRAKIKGNGGKLSKDIVQKLLTLQKGKCVCCGASLGNDYHLDHIVPLALGGMNDDFNVQLLTPKCNMSKGSKHPIDYMRSKGKLI
jgi:hypothetical protein